MPTFCFAFLGDLFFGFILFTVMAFTINDKEFSSLEDSVHIFEAGTAMLMANHIYFCPDMMLIMKKGKVLSSSFICMSQPSHINILKQPTKNQ